MVVAEKQTTQSEFLKPAFLKEKQLRRVKILDEFVLVESEFEDKQTHEKTKSSRYTGSVECQVSGNPTKIWAMNKTSSNAVIEVLGPETKGWIGCTVLVVLSNIAGNESIIVDEIGTREANPNKAIPVK